MNEKHIHAEAIQRAADAVQAVVEAGFTKEERAAVRRPVDEREGAVTMVPAELDEEALETFAFDAAVESLEMLAEEIHATIELRMGKLYAEALDVYYAMEELVRDPANAELIPLLEDMRRAHIQDTGREVPARPAAAADAPPAR